MVFVKRLVQLDVDSTFIQQEAIELLAAKAGVLEQVAAITSSAMRGEIDFEESLRARVALLKGLPSSAIDQVREEITLTDGAEELVEALHAEGHSVALVSGGFINIIEPMIKSLSIRYYRANELEIRDGVLTGGLIGSIVDRAGKATALREFAKLSAVSLENTVAVGDGANDLDMMAIAGLSIAFNAKPVVAQAADLSINEPSLKSVLDLIGLR
jgi:phosphoserine phosphatase